MKFSVFQLSRKGGRKQNEDRVGYRYTRDSAMLMLADGMGGHLAGEVAAQLALRSVSLLHQAAATPRLADVAAFLGDALLHAHGQIVQYAIDEGLSETPRTTVVVAVLQDGAAWWAHCGDSRLYLVRDGELVTRTCDHSFAERPGDTGAAAGSNRNVLFTCLGSPSRPQFDLEGPVALQSGDRILLCSDGLWDSLGQSDIVAQLSAKPVEQAVPDLVQAALQRAGPYSDNVSAIALEWESVEAA